MSRSPADLRPESDSSSQGIRAVRIALVMVGVIAAFFLLREYWGDVAGNALDIPVAAGLPTDAPVPWPRRTRQTWWSRDAPPNSC